MNRLIGILAALMIMGLVMVGCDAAPALSVNKRMAYANSGATLASAAALDQVAPEKFDTVKAELIAACEQLKSFLDDGMIADLPVEQAKLAVHNLMIEKGLSAYIGLVDVVFAWIDVQNLPVQHLGANNIVIIKSGLDGIIAQATRAKAEWATPFKAVPGDTTRGIELKINK